MCHMVTITGSAFGSEIKEKARVNPVLFLYAVSYNTIGDMNEADSDRYLGAGFAMRLRCAQHISAGNGGNRECGEQLLCGADLR